MSKHTPGPYTAHTNGLDWFVTAKDFHGATGKVAKLYVADVQKFRNADADDEAEANAKLFAAAPELLAALEELLDISAQEDTNRWRINDAEVDARIAIAKAKGESK